MGKKQISKIAHACRILYSIVLCFAAERGCEVIVSRVRGSERGRRDITNIDAALYIRDNMT